MRYRKAPAFHRSSSVARLSETQSSAGVIWSVSIASSFFPGRLGSQKIKARPRMVFMKRVYRAARRHRYPSPRTAWSSARAACETGSLSSAANVVEGTLERAPHRIEGLGLQHILDAGLRAGRFQLLKRS